MGALRKQMESDLVPHKQALGVAAIVAISAQYTPAVTLL
jgi:hypothetical protein